MLGIIYSSDIFSNDVWPRTLRIRSATRSPAWPLIYRATKSRQNAAAETTEDAAVVSAGHAARQASTSASAPGALLTNVMTVRIPSCHSSPSSAGSAVPPPATTISSFTSSRRKASSMVSRRIHRRESPLASRAHRSINRLEGNEEAAAHPPGHIRRVAQNLGGVAQRVRSVLKTAPNSATSAGSELCLRRDAKVTNPVVLRPL